MKNGIILEDRLSDSFNYKWSSLFLSISVFIIEISQYIAGNSIRCWYIDDSKWLPDNYAHEVFLRSEYYFQKIQNKTPPEYIKFKNDITSQYSSTFILFFQAFLFCIPHLIWWHWLADCKIDIKSIIRSVRNIRNYYLTALILKNYLDKIKFQCRLRRICRLSVLYLFVKVCYLINIVFQMNLTKVLIGSSSMFYGFKIIMNIIFSQKWSFTNKLPYIIFCEATKANVYRDIVNVECILPLHSFLQKVFILINIWITIVGIITTMSTLRLGYNVFYKKPNCYLIKSYMRTMEMKIRNKDCEEQFIDYLRHDGIFIITLISQNCGDIPATEIIRELWSLFVEEYNSKKSSTPISLQKFNIV